MPTLHVLVSEAEEVLGTFRPDGHGAGTAPPTAAGFRAAPRQRVIELEVDEATAALDPQALHETIKAKHLG
jgi:hypothetical protein